MNIGGVPQNKAVAQNSGCLTIFGIPFAAVGMWVGISTLWTLAGPYNIDREQVAMRLVMSVLFAGCGFGLIAWGRYSTKEVAKARETVGRSPDKPWLWREDWAQGYCAPEWRENARIMSIIGVAFLLFTLPMALQLPKELERGRYVVLIALVFPLTGTCLLVTSLTGYLRGQKFRGLKFVPAASPVPLGGRLKGKIQMTKELPQTTANLTLNCIRSYRSGSGSDSSHWETVQWQSRITVPVSFDGRDSFIPIDIPIPFDAQETDMRNPDNSIFWRLTASSKMPGLDFRATFLMPIFKTASSDSSVTIQSLDAKDEARLAGQQPREAQIDF